MPMSTELLYTRYRFRLGRQNGKLFIYINDVLIQEKAVVTPYDFATADFTTYPYQSDNGYIYEICLNNLTTGVEAYRAPLSELTYYAYPQPVERTSDSGVYYTDYMQKFTEAYVHGHVYEFDCTIRINSFIAWASYFARGNQPFALYSVGTPGELYVSTNLVTNTANDAFIGKKLEIPSTGTYNVKMRVGGSTCTIIQDGVELPFTGFTERAAAPQLFPVAADTNCNCAVELIVRDITDNKTIYTYPSWPIKSSLMKSLNVISREEYFEICDKTKGGGIELPFDFRGTKNSFTVITKCTIGADNGSTTDYTQWSHPIVSQGDYPSGANAKYTFMFGVANSNNVASWRIILIQSDLTDVLAYKHYTATPGLPQVAAFKVDWTALQCRLFVNGVLAATVAIKDLPLSSSTDEANYNRAWLFQRRQQYANVNDKIHKCLIYGEALSDEEIIRISKSL